MARAAALIAICACIVLQACVVYAPTHARGGVPYRNDAMFASIERGMTKEQVAAITGAPDNTMPFARSGNTSWGYFYWDTFGYYVEFSVTFGPDGRVVEKTYRRVNDGGNRP